MQIKGFWRVEKMPRIDPKLQQIVISGEIFAPPTLAPKHKINFFLKKHFSLYRNCQCFHCLVLISLILITTTIEFFSVFQLKYYSLRLIECHGSKSNLRNIFQVNIPLLPTIIKKVYKIYFYHTFKFHIDYSFLT